MLLQVSTAPVSTSDVSRLLDWLTGPAIAIVIVLAGAVLIGVVVVRLMSTMQTDDEHQS